MTQLMEVILFYVGIFFILYLILYASYLFVSVTLGAWQLYQRDQRIRIRNELKHDFYMPVSILVPAYNEEITIISSVRSLLELDYRLYEVIVVDDGSSDRTSQVLIDAFNMKKVKRPVHRVIPCRNWNAIYEKKVGNINLTLVCKENGGKGDALNMGINMSRFPYFLCLDADSMLQRDSLEKIVQPVLEDENIVAVGGLIRVAQCVKLVDGKVASYRLPNNPVTCMQVVEYDRSFLASRILMDQYNGNLIISGAFGLFKKSVVVEVGGYDTGTLGEDMELCVKLHVYCRKNMRRYSIKYEPNAVCWSQAPTNLKDLSKQRRRWYLGLFQCMLKYAEMFVNVRYGLVGALSYMYYFLFELISPFVEIFGIAITMIAAVTGMVNVPFMIGFFLLYGIYGTILTLTAFFQRIYTQNLKLRPIDVAKAIFMCLLENLFFRYVLSFVRFTSFIGYRQKKAVWGEIKREEQNV